MRSQNTKRGSLTVSITIKVKSNPPNKELCARVTTELELSFDHLRKAILAAAEVAK